MITGRMLKAATGMLIAGFVAIAVVMMSPYGRLVRAMVLGSVSNLVLHPPSPRDEFFNIVAVDFKRAALCDRIDKRADASSGGWDSEYQIRTLRSVCHRDAAPLPNESQVATPFSMAEFADQVRALGYTDADVLQAGYPENFGGTPVYNVYRSLLVSDDLRSRLRAHPGYAEPRDPARLRPAKPTEFLYQMVAVDGPDAAFCSRISPNATLTDTGGTTALLQSRCYLSIAINTRDRRLCEPLPAAGTFPHVNERYDSRERCQEAVAIHRWPDFNGKPMAGATPFPRAADFRTALLEIGYSREALPRIPEPTSEDYWEFVSRLIFRGPDSERAEFLRRVEAIK